MLDSRVYVELTGNRDAGEGARAFLERREPRFEDRLGENMSDWYPWVGGVFWFWMGGYLLTDIDVVCVVEGDGRQASQGEALGRCWCLGYHFPKITFLGPATREPVSQNFN